MANRRDAFSAYMYSGRCLSAGVYVEPKSLHLSPWILFTSQHKYCSWSYPHCSSGSCTCLRKSHSGETTLLPQWHVKDPGHPAKRTGGRLQLNTHAPYVCLFCFVAFFVCFFLFCFVQCFRCCFIPFIFHIYSNRWHHPRNGTGTGSKHEMVFKRRLIMDGLVG